MYLFLVDQKMKKKMGEACVTYWGQNYVQKFGRPLHREKEN
jgi:hypothetical protein